MHNLHRTKSYHSAQLRVFFTSATKTPSNKTSTETSNSVEGEQAVGTVISCWTLHTQKTIKHPDSQLLLLICGTGQKKQATGYKDNVVIFFFKTTPPTHTHTHTHTHHHHHHNTPPPPPSSLPPFHRPTPPQEKKQRGRK